jgi:hypothetical protein
VPSKINFSRCGQGYFESWRGRGWATDRWQQGPGQVDRLWILDVEGHRLVIDANYMPSATRKQRDELERIVHSIKFLADSSLGTIHVGAAGSSASPGCAQLRQLKSVFPRASAVGFRGRQAISPAHPRAPIREADAEPASRSPTAKRSRGSKASSTRSSEEEER